MRLILIAALSCTVNALAMDGEEPQRPYFSVPLGRYVYPANFQHAQDEVPPMMDVETAGDDAEASRYDALAPIEEEVSQEDDVDRDDLDMIEELFFGNNAGQ